MTSGGHFDNIGATVQEILEEMGEHPEIRKRWPILARVLPHFGDWLAKTEEAIDGDLDESDPDGRRDREFDLASAGALVDRILKSLPKMLFPLDRKMTIEKWQAMTGSPIAAAFVGEEYDKRDPWEAHDAG